MTDNFVPPQEWRPDTDERVVDDRPDTRGGKGTAIKVELDGPHFGDWSYFVTVRWDDGRTERRVHSHWLFREDGTQGPR